MLILFHVITFERIMVRMHRGFIQWKYGNSLVSTVKHPVHVNSGDTGSCKHNIWPHQLNSVHELPAVAVDGLYKTGTYVCLLPEKILHTCIPSH